MIARKCQARRVVEQLLAPPHRRLSGSYRMKMTATMALMLCVVAEGRAQSDVDSFDPGANGTVRTLAVQTDGKILVGGDFTTLGGGGTGTTTRNRIGRVNPDGTLDTSFDPGANNIVRTLVLQADGKILVGGDFTTLGGGGMGTTGRSRIGRLNPDGTLDTSFDPGASREVYALAVQADGKILVGGIFFKLGGGGTGQFTRDLIGRLNPDGTLDTGFDPGASDIVDTLVVQADGKILVGGSFTKLGGGGIGTTTRNRIGRLNPDGTLDTSFDPGADGVVFVLAEQPDKKILVGGGFDMLGGGGTGTTTRYSIGRLHPDGTLDTSFDPGSDLEAGVFTLELQPDGKILVGGAFAQLDGVVRINIGRLHADGTLDTSFDPGANLPVEKLVLQPDGKILVGGVFTLLGGGGNGITARSKIGRLVGVTPTPSQPLNISTRLNVQTGDNVLIGGFIITGADPKKVLIRAIGPSLVPLGVPNALANPILELHEPDGTVVTNDNWRDTQEQEIIDTTIPPTNDLESAILATLDPGAYTGIVRGTKDTTGVGLVEAYDLDQAVDSQLANISTRGFVQTDDNVMIGGFILGGGGGGSSTVIVRGIGPSLTEAGVANAMADPTLELHDGDGNLIDSNDNWMDDPDMQIISDDGLAPTDPNESALLGVLPPGGYTAIIRGVDRTIGVALVEVYNLGD